MDLKFEFVAHSFSPDASEMKAKKAENSRSPIMCAYILPNFSSVMPTK